MTREELRAHPEYAYCMGKIRGYKPGFVFTLNYNQIPFAKANALRIVVEDAVKAGWLRLENFNLDFYGHCTDETLRRTDKIALVPMPGTTSPDWGKKHWGQEDEA